MRNTVAKDDSAHARRRPPKARKVVTSTKVTKLAVSFPPDLALNVWKAAQRTTKGNLSAWLAEAARNELRRDVLTQLVAEWEAERGRPYSEEELEKSSKRLGW
jgi:hypothetical protein